MTASAETINLTPLPTPTADDIKRLQACDSSVRVRCLIEGAIVRKAVESLIAAGYYLSLHNGEDWGVGNTQDVGAVMNEIAATDNDTLYVSKQAKCDPGNFDGYVDFVYGNTGWDVISDYTTNLEVALKPANEYAEQMAEWC